MSQSKRAEIAAIILLNGFAKKLRQDKLSYDLLKKVQVFHDDTMNRSCRFGFYGFLETNFDKPFECSSYLEPTTKYQIGQSVDWLIGETPAGNNSVNEQSKENYQTILRIFSNYDKYIIEDENELEKYTKESERYFVTE